VVIRDENERVYACTPNISMADTRDETWSYGGQWKEATYTDSSGSQIPFKDKNHETIRYLDVLMYTFGGHQQFFHVRKDDDYETVIVHIPTRTIEKLTPELAEGMERL